MWQERLNEALIDRDKQLGSLRSLYAAFTVASARAAKADLSSSPEQTIEAALDLANQFRLKAATLEAQLRSTTSELERMQSRAREIVEEHYMKTQSVQSLNDEILALTIQLNLSEARLKQLQSDPL